MSRFLIGLAAVWIFAGGFGSAETSACGGSISSQRECKPCKRPDGSLNHSPNVTGLALDKSDLQFKPVSTDSAALEIRSAPDQLINVTTNAEDAENDVLDYSYTVTSGRIIGSGSNVSWDLSGSLPGTYRITAKVDDSCGVCGKTITKTVRIIGKTPVAIATPAPIPATKPAVITTTTATPPTTAKASKSLVIERPAPAVANMRTTAITPATAAAPAAVPGSCPKVLITDPERSGDELIFTTKIFDLSTANRLTYIWTVMGGSVVSQDKATVHIKPGILGGSIKVSVNGFDPKGACPNTAEKKF
jgi:hypothetical protein